MRNERIELTDSILDVVTKMSDGNIGAMEAITEIIMNNSIDPNNQLGGVGVAMLLDTYGIYGCDIYVLHSDLCYKNSSRTLAVLRACQLGIFNPIALKSACSVQDYSGRELVPVEELYLKVKERLPQFNS